MHNLNNRFALKIAGASGQGINVVGEILAKAFLRSGFGVFAYREYPSLIKGGHATYQIDVSNNDIESSTQKVDWIMVLNKQATNWHLDDLKDEGLVFHDIDNPRINKEELIKIQRKNIHFIYIPALKLSIEAGGNELTSNIVTLGTIWKLLNLSQDLLVEVVRDKFASKPKIIEIDINCVKKGFDYKIGDLPNYAKRLLKPDEIDNDLKNSIHLKDVSFLQKFFKIDKIINKNEAINIQLTGNEALALGAINAGVRIHYSYPMTPSSSILDYLAETAHQTGMIVKQAEDEITAAAMAIGSMFMGTRALTATSGGGFDLMTEHVSLSAITEIPFVCVIGQRPGPATGMPTWTTQGDLMLSIFAGHGEFTRCVIAPSNAEDTFYSIQEAFNIAEIYQIPVIVLTDKFIAESIYKVIEFDTTKIQIIRGDLIVDQEQLDNIKSIDRYKITDNGISPRWLPGSKAVDYNTNSDEHDGEGNVTEDGEIAEAMIAKRIRKKEKLLHELLEPVIYSNNVETSKRDINIIGWGSTYSVMHDVMNYFKEINIKINYLHVKYMWPLKIESITNLLQNDPQTLLIECNHESQLGEVIMMKTGLDIKNKLLKWNGRPFFVDEVINYIETKFNI